MLTFTDVLINAGIDPKKVKLIRHALTDKNFKECYDCDMIYEYTCHQKTDFSKGYEYWAVFISGSGTLAKFHSIYHVGESVPDTRDMIPNGLPKAEASCYNGKHAIYKLEHIDILSEYENKLTIQWGKSTRSWHQKGTTGKEIVSLQPDKKKIFPGYEHVVISYDELKDIIDNPTAYEDWIIPLKSIYAIYLIVDTETGKQYVGSAYNTKDGLFGRWSCYVATKHGGNKLMKEELCAHPDRYHKFRFSILQVLPKTLSPEEVTDIETLYKEKLLSKEFGMNAN